MYRNLNREGNRIFATEYSTALGKDAEVCIAQAHTAQDAANLFAALISASLPAPDARRAWRFSVLQPRQNAERNVRMRSYIAFAPTAEEAQRAVAFELGEHGLNYKISAGHEIDYSEPLQTDSGSYARSVEETFRGRIVRDILAEIALESHRAGALAKSES